jgi:pyridoxal 5'-phosphate synthase pdxT subunit
MIAREQLTVGVLALQGDFDAHRRRLEELGAKVILVRKAEQLDDIGALVIPGGESTTFLKLMGDKFLAKLQEFVRLKPTFGTCAGAILLSNEVQNPPQQSLAVLDAAIQRNAYGRQIDSSIREVSTSLPGGPLEAVFIRAPRFGRIGKNVEVIAKDGDTPIMLRQGNVLAATFHPELSPDPRVHQYFLDLVAQNGKK